MTEVHVRPEAVEQGSRETLPWRFDTSPLLSAGETPGTPTATLTNLTTSALYPAGLSGSPIVSGTDITQAVTALAARTTYRLSVGFTAGAKVWEMALEIACPF